MIDCPDPRLGRSTLDGVAKDGIQLKARARVTVRTNLSQLIGGVSDRRERVLSLIRRLPLEFEDEA